MMPKTADDLFKRYLPVIERGLDEYLPAETGCDAARAALHRAMRYAVLDGGKRIRPVLLLEFCRVCGGDILQALPFACALEMIHSYSLIHDDLPCMDDDDMRRGKPSVHRAFGEATALLAGDALLNCAFETMLCHPAAPDATIEAAGCLAVQSGAGGMIGGQMIDLASEGKSVGLEELRRMDDGKTVALIRAACRMGCILGARRDLLAYADGYAENIGMAFQIRDDILDVSGDAAQLGKPVGSDEANQKSTYVSLLGLTRADSLVRDMTHEAQKALAPFGEAAGALCDLAVYLADRNH